jgi:beta-glucosidase
LNTSTQVTFDIAVDEAGIYRCQAEMRYERDALAQSSCSLSINDLFSMSFPIHGTDGATQQIKGLEVRLNKGLYTFSIDFVKPGAVLEVLHLNKV